MLGFLTQRDTHAVAAAMVAAMEWSASGSIVILGLIRTGKSYTVWFSNYDWRMATFGDIRQ